MIPLLTSEAMRREDAAAIQRVGQENLLLMAGTAVAQCASSMLQKMYGATIAVLAGPGLNGEDGKLAGEWLRSRGARIDVVPVATQPLQLNGYELVIDAAFGIGCSRPYVAPTVPNSTKVLAVDVPSGVNADTGEVFGSPLKADVTLALGAYKYAHLQGDAASYVGDLRFSGLDIVRGATNYVIEDDDLLDFVVQHEDDHKWKYGVLVFAGSTLMPGAAQLVTRGAQGAGASMIRLVTHGPSDLSGLAPEIVRSSDVVVDSRFKSVVAGPGLGAECAIWLNERLRDVRVPVVLDADGLQPALASAARSNWVMTPHEGEFERLTGAKVSAHRIDAVRDYAKNIGCTVLLKGPTTVIASPEGMVRVVRRGTPALATAGSGDVLSGMIGGAIARGHSVLNAAALSAHLHAVAGTRLAPYEGASALTTCVTEVLSELRTRST